MHKPIKRIIIRYKPNTHSTTVSLISDDGLLHLIPPHSAQELTCFFLSVSLWPAHRAFVLADDLPLSPRHEQAKRLLERARMKARSNPIKADHTILPVQRDNP